MYIQLARVFSRETPRERLLGAGGERLARDFSGRAENNELRLLARDSLLTRDSLDFSRETPRETLERDFSRETPRENTTTNHDDDDDGDG